MTTISTKKILKKLPIIIFLILIIAIILKGPGSTPWIILYWSGMVIISIWGPIYMVFRFLYPQGENIYLTKYLKMPIQCWNNAYINSLKMRSRFARIFGVLSFSVIFPLILFYFSYRSHNIFFAILGVIQVLSLIISFLFAYFFPNIFFSRYKKIMEKWN